MVFKSLRGEVGKTPVVHLESMIDVWVVIVVGAEGTCASCCSGVEMNTVARCAESTRPT